MVLLVSASLCCCALCAKKFALRGLMVGVSAKKFALHAYNTPKSAFLRLLGEFFAEVPVEGLCWASFSRKRGWRVRAGRVFRANRPCAQVLWATWRTRLAAVGVLQH